MAAARFRPPARADAWCGTGQRQPSAPARWRATNGTTRIPAACLSLRASPRPPAALRLRRSGTIRRRAALSLRRWVYHSGRRAELRRSGVRLSLAAWSRRRWEVQPSPAETSRPHWAAPRARRGTTPCQRADRPSRAAARRRRWGGLTIARRPTPSLGQHTTAERTPDRWQRASIQWHPATSRPHWASTVVRITTGWVFRLRRSLDPCDADCQRGRPVSRARGRGCDVRFECGHERGRDSGRRGRLVGSVFRPQPRGEFLCSRRRGCAGAAAVGARHDMEWPRAGPLDSPHAGA